MEVTKRWILILFLTGYSEGATQIGPFDTLKACQSAAKVSEDTGYIAAARCVYAGEIYEDKEKE